MNLLVVRLIAFGGLALASACHKPKPPVSEAVSVDSPSEGPSATKEQRAGANSADKAEKKGSIGEYLSKQEGLSIAERIALYKELKEREPQSFNFEDNKELNQYGYSLLFSGKGEEAIEVFKLLVSEFPDRANSYDSLAQAYKHQKNKELALLNYEKSLELNPKNSRAAFEVDVMKGRLDILGGNWKKEIFTLPVPFAKAMTLSGFEDARFTNGWAKADSDEFWSYVFAWKVELEGKSDEAIAKGVLEKNLEMYFDGLMGNDAPDSSVPKAVAELKVRRRSKNLRTYKGSIDFLDTRLTKKRLTLQIKAESR